MVAKKKRQNDPQNDSSTDSSEEKQQDTCSHVNKAVHITKLRKEFKLKNVFANDNCSECAKTTNGTTSTDTDDNTEFPYDKTLWLCLNCGSHLCGNSKKDHAIHHFKTPHSDSHALVLNTTTLETFCYECNTEVIVKSNKRLKECCDFVKREMEKSKEKLENVPNNLLNTIRPLLEAVPGTSMSNPQVVKAASNAVDALPRVRGLTNLGNTCFFNAVMQCLAQTPYLLTVLNGAVPGEEFELPGGTHVIKEGESIELPSIGGKLGSRFSLTTKLAETLEELQKSGGVYNPRDLFEALTKKCPQFSGGDQHDSHELLRHLLESVRTEDMTRYRKVILEVIGWWKKDSNDAPDEVKHKCKFYGLQVQNRIPIPDQVFQGKLVSTLVCQDCMHTSPRQEHFLDISLPINVETPKPPQRRKSSPEPIVTVQAPSKHQLKKEKERDKKLKRAQRHHNNKGASSSDPLNATKSDENSLTSTYRSSSSSEHSDADVEDNLIEDAPKNDAFNNINRVIPPLYDSNGNNTISPTSSEKRDECPENSNKDSDDDENDSGIANSPTKAAVDTDGQPISRCDFVPDLPAAPKEKVEAEFNNTVVEATISSEGRAKLLRQRSDRLDEVLTQEMDALKLNGRLTKRIRTISSMEWSSTIAPRYTCKENECSIQSCLNNFTAMELMSGNNQVGCDVCTEMFHGKSGKTYKSNATKQFLISSPPAVLILHLKRFQVYPRYMFRKLTKTVTFPFVLDLAPFCASKVKTLPNVKSTQTKLLYSLYGIVEHAGGMHGGHYTAYVKVRPKLTPDDPRWQFLPQGCKAELQKKLDGQQQEKQSNKPKSLNNHGRNLENDDSDDSLSSHSSIEECEGAVGGSDDQDVVVPPGKWFYVSDSHVQEASEDRVLNAQAYLLFYERIY
ncbi:Ubiquitin carboxyl-terminal hydrolase 45 [Pseudolycoriella hygida]|uniref:Ubiquitin carboxyl-terminal hydrolase n=1 Tax=Pseudolycoriella hygida TaxID=35572 RepID=A0A9Q0RYV9_9DIPT|nr:Ubiquitin carboxyl-terminal hydrolase 45 [Pseudolycoriella hygida]